MKKLFLISSALVFAGPAMAADLPARPAPMPVKAAVVAPLPYSWTGCYVGGHVGAGWDHTTFTDPGNTLIFGTGQVIAPAGGAIGVNGGAGFLGGVQAGCDYQFANNWVVGIGGDFAWSQINGLANDPFFTGKNGAPVPLNTSTDRIGSLTGRIGYAFDHLLFYAKGGGAYAHDNYSIQNASCFFFSCGNLAGSADRIGWAAGVGLEWSFAANWSALVEYDHYGFGYKGIGFTSSAIAPTSFVFNVKQDIDIVKVGINYRFGGPVVARY